MNWRKSSHSSPEGQECLEVNAVWKKSSYSTAKGEECLEAGGPWTASSYSSPRGQECVEAAWDDRIQLRDSKNPAIVLAFPISEWASLSRLASTKF